LPVPPYAEQKNIVRNIEYSVADLNTIITRTEREISLLREYKTRLIADVVTGKLDVREAARLLPEDIGEPETLNDAQTPEAEDGEEDLTLEGNGEA
jgi:type I restriction enzyme S subunit